MLHWRYDLLCSSNGSLALASGHEVLLFPPQQHKHDLTGGLGTEALCAPRPALFLSRHPGASARSERSTTPSATVTAAGFVGKTLVLGDDVGVATLHDAVSGSCLFRQRVAEVPILGLSLERKAASQATGAEHTLEDGTVSSEDARVCLKNVLPVAGSASALWLLLAGGGGVSLDWGDLQSACAKLQQLQAAQQDAALVPPVPFLRWHWGAQGDCTCIAATRAPPLHLLDEAWTHIVLHRETHQVQEPATGVMIGGAAPALSLFRAEVDGNAVSLATLATAVASSVGGALSSAAAKLDDSIFGSMASSFGFGSFSSALGGGAEAAPPADAGEAIATANAEAAAKLRSAPCSDLSPVASLGDGDRCVTHLSVSPCGRMALAGDSFGRVMLLRCGDCGLLRLWKGYRGAQFAWALVRLPLRGGRSRCASVALLLSPQRGVLEAWEAPGATRLAAWEVGKHAALLPLGTLAGDSGAVRLQGGAVLPSAAVLLVPAPQEGVQVGGVQVPPGAVAMYRFG